jgi:hypothetical protein
MALSSGIAQIWSGAVIAMISAVGGGVASSVFLSADVERATDVQMVELAVGLLTAQSDGDLSEDDRVLREWAVDTLNETAAIKFDERARIVLINGTSNIAFDLDGWFNSRTVLQFPAPPEPDARYWEMIRDSLPEANQHSAD